MMRILGWAVIASVGLAQAGTCAPKAEGGKGKVVVARAEGGAAGKASSRVDIRKWPVYTGAKLVQEVHVGGDQLNAFAGNKEIPPDARKALEKLLDVVVLGYQLPDRAEPRGVIDFYEPRILAAGYKMMVKDFSDPKDSSAVYTSADGGLLVLSVENEDPEDGYKLEIVSVQGNLKDISKLGVLGKLGGAAAPKAPPPAKTPEALKASPEPEKK
jgi:hypothetical protein